MQQGQSLGLGDPAPFVALGDLALLAWCSTFGRHRERLLDDIFKLNENIKERLDTAGIEIYLNSLMCV